MLGGLKLPATTSANQQEVVLNDNLTKNRPAAEDALWTIPTAAAFFGVSTATFYRGVADGRYPTPIRTGLRAVRVSATECRQRLEAMKAGRPA
jgi:predicted DNA-binding transcriptional regulator AlpA